MPGMYHWWECPRYYGHCGCPKLCENEMVFEITSIMQSFMVSFHRHQMQDTNCVVVIVHTWFHLDEIPLTSLVINSLPRH
jgi:hypothetical protein